MKRRPELGFSALELVTIAGIILVIAAVALPNAISARRSYVLLASAEALSQQLTRCRREAVRVNDRMRIKVFAGKTILDLQRDEDFDAADDAEASLGEAVVTTFNPANGEVEYTSRGELPIGASVSFSLVYLDKQRIVTVEQRGAPIIGPEIPV